MKPILLRALVVCLPLAALGCGADLDTGENYGDILASTSGLTLTEAEHGVGWGSSTCTMCHNLENIHLENRSSLAIDIDAIHDQAIATGESGCAACHGTNGVP